MLEVRAVWRPGASAEAGVDSASAIIRNIDTLINGNVKGDLEKLMWKAMPVTLMLILLASLMLLSNIENREKSIAEFVLC